MVIADDPCSVVTVRVLVLAARLMHMGVRVDTIAMVVRVIMCDVLMFVARVRVIMDLVPVPVLVLVRGLMRVLGHCVPCFRLIPR